MRSRCLDIGQICFCDFLWTETKLRFLKTHKKEWGWYPAIMTKQAWSIKDKFYSKKISFYQESWMTCLIGEPRKKGNCVCNTIKPGDRVVYVFVFVLIVFCCFLQLHCQHCPKVTTIVSLLHATFFMHGNKVGNLKQAKWGSQSEHRICFIFPMSTASDVLKRFS